MTSMTHRPDPGQSAAASTAALPPPDASAAISMRALSRVFRRGDHPHTAVDALSLDIPRGSFYGLVGRNGAGKTTALSMATGLLRPTAGTVLVAGQDVWADPRRAKALLGVLPDGMRSFDRLSGRQLVTCHGMLRGMDRKVVAERAEDLLRAMDLEAAADQSVQDYSAGMTKKILLACALVHAPSVLVLDEPFEAVDPVSAANIRGMLHAFVQAGGTVVVSSHVMDLVQRMCDHVAIMDSGRLLAAGTVDQVRGERSLEDVFVELVGGGRPDAGEELAWLRPR